MHEQRDPAEVLGDGQPPPGIAFQSHREDLCEVIAKETSMRTDGVQFVSESEEGASSLAYRAQMNSEGSPSETVSVDARHGAGARA